MKTLGKTLIPLGLLATFGPSIPNQFVDNEIKHFLSYNVSHEQFFHADDNYENSAYNKLEQHLITASGSNTYYQVNPSSIPFIDAYKVFNKV